MIEKNLYYKMPTCQYRKCSNPSKPHINENQRCHYCASHEKTYWHYRKQFKGGEFNEAFVGLCNPSEYYSRYGKRVDSNLVKEFKDIMERALFYRRKFRDVFWGGKSDDEHRAFEDIIEKLLSYNPLNEKNIRKTLIRQRNPIYKNTHLKEEQWD